MARQRFAPSHSCTGPHIFIPLDDSAWDLDRIEREIAEIEAEHKYEPPKDALERMQKSPAFRGPHAHVVRRYWSGVTRFDIEAEGIRSYLDFNKRPEQWVLRPLGMRERHTATSMQNSGEWDAANIFGFLSGVGGLQGAADTAAVELDKLLRARADDAPTPKGTRPSDDVVLKAVEKIAYDIPHEVGAAVIRLSRDVSEEEKKRSAGPRGGSSETGTASPASEATPGSASATA